MCSSSGGYEVVDRAKPATYREFSRAPQPAPAVERWKDPMTPTPTTAGEIRKPCHDVPGLSRGLISQSITLTMSTFLFRNPILSLTAALSTGVAIEKL